MNEEQSKQKLGQFIDHNYYGICATIIADSKNMYGHRLTSYVWTFPRFILAEVNTHRMLSRNSASSRAIPFKTMVNKVMDHPFIPIKWMKDHKGMQGAEYFENDYDSEELSAWWLGARDKAVAFAKDLNKIGLTKQMCNRLLEPFLWHTIIITGTEWENFFALRADDAAEIHFQKLAYMALEQANLSKPKLLKPGEWHIPFGDNLDQDRVAKLAPTFMDMISVRLKIATARNARISYTNFEGKDDYAADVKLHDKLFSYPHASPFEHCGQAMGPEQFNNNRLQSGNFTGFTQYRKTLKNENRSDERLLKK